MKCLQSMILEKLNSDKLKSYFSKLGLNTALVFGSVLTVEHLISMLLKEHKKFKIGINMK